MGDTNQEVIQKYAAQTNCLTAAEGINYVLVSPKGDPQIICIIAEMWYVLAPNQFDILHSGRVPREA